MADNQLIIAVSPTRRTMQLAGSYGTVIGASISAVANDRYKQRLYGALGEGYDLVPVITQRLSERLDAAIDAPLERVDPMTSTAGYHTRRDARTARCEGLAKQGFDSVLDLKAKCGVFGPEGTLVVTLGGDLRLLPEDIQLWANHIFVADTPVLASDKLTDPTKNLTPDFSMRLKADKDAISQWTRDDGATLRQAIEDGVDAAVSAVLCDLGLAQEAVGEYRLGRLAIASKEFKKADNHLRKAHELDPECPRIRNAMAVNAAYDGRVDEAIRKAKAITESNPDFAPPWFNLAWWHAIDREDLDAAKSFYERALKLGLGRNDKLDKKLGLGE